MVGADAARKLEAMLVEAVDSGTGKAARLRHFRIAGKTSTAQRVDGEGGYRGHVSGFVGFPVGAGAKHVIYVYIDGPQDHYYGNVVAGPVFRRVAEHMLYRNRVPDPPDPGEGRGDEGVFDTVGMRQSSARDRGEGRVPNFIGLDKRSALDLAGRHGIGLVQRGMGVVERQTPPPGSEFGRRPVRLFYGRPRHE